MHICRITLKAVNSIMIQKDFILRHLQLRIYRFHVSSIRSFHPELPIIASSSGRRHVGGCPDSDDSTDEEIETSEASVKLWWIKFDPV